MLLPESAKAEALDACQDVAGGLGPSERFGLGICGLDVSFDGGFEFADRGEDAALEGSLGQQRKKAFNLVEPGRRGGREVHMPARALQEPIADQLGFVRAVVVHDNVDVEIGGHVALDLLEEFTELLCPVPPHARADDGSGFHIERREQRGGPVALVVMVRRSGPHGQQRLAAVKGLHLRLSSTQSTKARSGGLR